MTPLPATPTGVVRFQLLHEIGTDLKIRPRFELAYTGGPPVTADLAVLAGLVRVAWGAHLASLMTSASGLFGVIAIDLANPSTPAGEDNVFVGGSASGTQQPVNVCVLLNKQIARRYRGAKPKGFLPYGTDTDIANTTSWSTGFVTAVNTQWAAFIAALLGEVAAGTTLGGEVSVSYFAGKALNPNPTSRLRYISTQRAVPLVSPITGYSCSVVFGSQRRRLRPR